MVTHTLAQAANNWASWQVGVPVLGHRCRGILHAIHPLQTVSEPSMLMQGMIRPHAGASVQKSSSRLGAGVQEPGDGGRKRGVARRVVLTATALLERRPATYEVAERRPLASIAALVRFAEQPLWMAVEWTDGTPPSMFITAAREALLTATLDAAQVQELPPVVPAAAVVFQGARITDMVAYILCTYGLHKSLMSRFVEA